MRDNKKSSTSPALERGLTILEYLARTDAGVSFQHIIESLQLPKASAARLLRVLRNRGYITKHSQTGLYSLGPSAALLGSVVSPLDSLRALCPPILASLRDQSNNTSIILYWSGRELLCVDKNIAPTSVSMRPVGMIGTDMEIAPWSWVLWSFLDEKGRNEALARAEMKSKFHRTIKNNANYFANHGYAFDDEEGLKYIRRLAAPIFGMDGIVGCLAVGGNLLTIPDDRVDPIGKLLITKAKELTTAIGGRWQNAPELH